MGEIRALIFDFGGTLDRPGRQWFDRFARHYAACGLEPDREALRGAYDSATQAGYRAGAPLHGFGLGRLLEFLVELQVDHLRRSGQLCRPKSCAASYSPPDDAAVARRIARRFARESRIGMRRAREQLALIAPRFRLGVASNFYGNLEVVLAENGLLDFFEVVADSGRVGVVKPAPEIFTYVLRKLRLEPREAAMVGDSLDNDCRPARKLGMKAVWMVEDRRLAERNLDGNADYLARNIAEVARLPW